VGCYQFWLLNEADERTQGLNLACEAEREAWLVADALLLECRAVEIWDDRDLVGRVGAAPVAIVEAPAFVWPQPTKRRARSKTPPKPRAQSGAQSGAKSGAAPAKARKKTG